LADDYDTVAVSTSAADTNSTTVADNVTSGDEPITDQTLYDVTVGLTTHVTTTLGVSADNGTYSDVTRNQTVSVASINDSTRVAVGNDDVITVVSYENASFSSGSETVGDNSRYQNITDDATTTIIEYNESSSGTTAGAPVDSENSSLPTMNYDNINNNINNNDTNNNSNNTGVVDSLTSTSEDGLLLNDTVTSESVTSQTETEHYSSTRANV